jgi:hypothetical protein
MMAFLLYVVCSSSSPFKGTRIATGDEHSVVLSNVLISVTSHLDSDGPSVGGGAIYLSSEASRLDVSDSTFYACAAYGADAAEVRGGACWLFSSVVNITRTCAVRCASAGWGHFVSMAGRAGVRDFNQTTVLECAPSRSPTSHSGAVHAYGDINLQFRAANFTKCQTRNDGAAIFVESAGAAFSARDCDFSGCEAGLSIVYGNCEASIERSNIVSNTIGVTGGTIFGAGSGMRLEECFFSGNAKGADVFRAGKGTNFIISRCCFDDALPDAAFCDFVGENRAFVVAAAHAGGGRDPRRCETRPDAGGHNQRSFELGSGSPSSGAVAQSSSMVIGIGLALAGTASVLSISVFVYALCRSRAHERHPDYDAVCKRKDEENDQEEEEAPVPVSAVAV